MLYKGNSLVFNIRWYSLLSKRIFLHGIQKNLKKYILDLNYYNSNESYTEYIQEYQLYSFTLNLSLLLILKMQENFFLVWVAMDIRQLTAEISGSTFIFQTPCTPSFISSFSIILSIHKASLFCHLKVTTLQQNYLLLSWNCHHCLLIGLPVIICVFL